jgi:hypothetical protein
MGRGPPGQAEELVELDEPEELDVDGTGVALAASPDEPDFSEPDLSEPDLSEPDFSEPDFDESDFDESESVEPDDDPERLSVL